MLDIEYTNKFQKDLKKVLKRGKDRDKFKKIITLLTEQKTIPQRYFNHKLTGNYKDHWELHIEPDWLLIYLISDEILTLVRTGTHSDLF